MSFKIGEVSVECGEKKSGKIEVAELHDGAKVNISFIIINGAESGPVLLVTSGHEGLNYSAIEAARRLSKIEPKKLRGTLVVVPIMNSPAFMLKSSQNIVEQSTDLFGSFPGKPDGNVTQRIAHVITNAFISKADYYIHMMNGRLGGPRINQIVFYPCPEDMLEKEVEFATAFGAPYISDAHNKITQRLESRPTTVACSKGIPAIMSIQGESSTLSEKIIENQHTGVLNVLKYYNMIDGEPEYPKGFTVYDMINFPRSTYSGFIEVKVAMGDRVKKGQLLAEVTDEFFYVKEQIISTAKGVVTKIPKVPTVGCGEQIGVQISINYCDTISAKKLYELSKKRPPTP